MAIITKVPKELTEYKGGVFMGLSVRQMICFGIAGIIAIPLYFLGRKYIGDDLAGWVVILIGMPCFAFAVITPNGLPFEKYLKIMFRHKFTPQIRRYRINNFYDELIQQEELYELHKAQKKEGKRGTKKSKESRNPEKQAATEREIGSKDNTL